MFPRTCIMQQKSEFKESSFCTPWIYSTRIKSSARLTRVPQWDFWCPHILSERISSEEKNLDKSQNNKGGGFGWGRKMRPLGWRFFGFSWALCMCVSVDRFETFQKKRKEKSGLSLMYIRNAAFQHSRSGFQFVGFDSERKFSCCVCSMGFPTSFVQGDYLCIRPSMEGGKHGHGFPPFGAAGEEFGVKERKGPDRKHHHPWEKPPDICLLNYFLFQKNPFEFPKPNLGIRVCNPDSCPRLWWVSFFALSFVFFSRPSTWLSSIYVLTIHFVT